METLSISLWVVAMLVVVALAFDFMNGFHDAANSIATVVSTRVLKPYQAVLMAAFFNFVAVFVFHLSVATTVGKGIIDQGIIDHYVVFGALTGAIAWNLITWYYGIPSSSSHALIGGIVGAGVAKAGTWALIPSGILKTVAFIFISPLIGFVLGAMLLLAISWLFVRVTPSRVDRVFRRLQLVLLEAPGWGLRQAALLRIRRSAAGGRGRWWAAAVLRLRPWIDPAGMDAAAQRVRHLGIDLAAETGQATERRLHMPARAAEPVVQIEVPKRGVEIVEPHQPNHAAAEPDAFGVSGRAVDGLRGLQELVGLALVVLGDVGGGGRGRLAWVLCA